ncbi:hypothetical protein HK100_006545 [Physocladia obscura]|uniref:Uncharacterized protein n=1 Tax=Physocladia obscura TaxID=109957 RepID=A0AAD5SQC2_9FUNG|nr:hypothetical protein HK100_006545 [Physocladia obscura]
MIDNIAPIHEQQQSYGPPSTTSVDRKRSIEIIKLLAPRQRTPRHSTLITKSMIITLPETSATTTPPATIFYPSPPNPLSPLSTSIDIDDIDTTAKIVSDSQGLFSSPHALLGSSATDSDDNAQTIPEFVLEPAAGAIAMSDSELENPNNSGSNFHNPNNSMLQPSPKSLQFMAFMRAQRRRPLAMQPPPAPSRPKQQPRSHFIGLRGNNISNNSRRPPLPFRLGNHSAAAANSGIQSGGGLQMPSVKL